jgi:hypothetical protein
METYRQVVIRKKSLSRGSLLPRVTHRSYQHTRPAIQWKPIHLAMPHLDGRASYQAERAH